MITNNLQKRSQLLYTQSLPLPQNSREALPRHANLAFEGLTNKLGNCALLTPEEVHEILLKYPNSNGVVGNLPTSWLEKIPKENRGETIKQFYKEINQAVTDFRDHDEYELNMEINRIKDKLPENLTKISDRFNKAFHKAGILPEGQNVKLKKLGSGDYGTAYLIDGIETDKNEELILKVFYINELNKEALEYLNSGKYPEINRAQHWLENVDKKQNPRRAFYNLKTDVLQKVPQEEREERKNSQKTRFFFGDLNAGYMVNRYVSDDAQRPKNKVSDELVGYTKPEDLNIGENLKRGCHIDFGEIVIENPALAQEKTPKWLYKKFYNLGPKKRMKLWNEYFTGKEFQKREDIKVGLVAVLPLLPEEEFLKCYGKLAENATNRVKRPLAYFMNRLPEEEVVGYFRQFAQNADNSVKLPLLEQLNKMPKKEFSVYLKQFAENANNPVKRILADKLSFFPKEERLKYFKQLAENSTNPVKRALIGESYHLPEERVECLKMFLEKTDNDIKLALAGQISAIPEDQIEDYIKKLNTNSSMKVKKVIAQKLNYIPENKRANCLVEVAESVAAQNKPDLGISSYFINQLSEIPDNDKPRCYSAILKFADEMAIQSLERKTQYFPPKTRKKCLEEIRKHSSQEPPGILKATSSAFRELIDNIEEFRNR